MLHSGTLAQPSVLTPSLAAGPWPSADLLRQLDDDPLRAADVAEPIDVFVVLHLVDELTAAGSHPGNGSLDAVDCECEMGDAQGVRRRVPGAPSDPPGVELRPLPPSLAVRGLAPPAPPPDAPPP